MLNRDEVKVGDYVKWISDTVFRVTHLNPFLKGTKIVNGKPVSTHLGGLKGYATPLEVMEYRLKELKVNDNQRRR